MTVARRIMRTACATLVARAVAPAVAAGQNGADGGEWRSYAGGRREHQVLTAGADHTGERRRARRCLAVGVD